MDNIKFGRKVAELREAHGFSQYQLGKLLKVSYQAVSKWETGKAIPVRSTVDKLSGILGFDFNPMLNEDLTPDEAEDLVNRQKEMLWKKAEARMKELYGEDPPLPVRNRFILERSVLHRGKSVFLFDIFAQIRDAAKKKPARFDASGCECFTAWLLGATDVNPLEPHLWCPRCHKVVFHPEVQSGWDLKEEFCECGGRMEPDGQGIPAETDIMGEGYMFEFFRCPVDRDFMDEAERIVLTYGEQFFAMEIYREKEESGFVKDPETGETVYDPETGEKIPYHHLPMSSMMFRPKKKAAARKPGKISGPSELINWGRRTGQPVIVLLPDHVEPYYLSKPTPFRSSPDKLVRQDIMERALRDYWAYHSGVMEERANIRFPDLDPYIGKLTFGKFITLICSVNTLYMVSGPEELAEKTGFTDLTDLPLSMEDLWKLISRSTAYPGYMSGAASEILLKVRSGKYLCGEYLEGIQPRDRKLFREMNLPDWFETYASNVFMFCWRTPCIDLGIRLLEDARRKIRERR